MTATFDDFIEAEHRLAHAARAYVSARNDLENAVGADLIRCEGLVGWAWHELRIAAGYDCSCDVGTCPSTSSGDSDRGAT